MTEKFQCHARRHMDEEFRVYDAMLAVARRGWNEAKAAGVWPDGRTWKETDPLICYAKVYTLANMTNRDEKRVTAAQSSLKEDGWLVPLQVDQRRRIGGEFTSFQYIVIEHDSYVTSHLDTCPAMRYDPDTGRRLQAGRQPRGLERKWVQRLIGAVLPDSWTDVIADAIWAKKENTATGNPVTVGTYPEITPEQVLAERAAGRTRPTDGGAHTPHGSGHTRPTDRGAHTPHKPVTHLKPESSACETPQPEKAVVRPENGEEAEKQNPSESLGSSTFQRHEDEKGGDHREVHERTVHQHFDGFLVFSTLAEVSGERLNLKTSEWSEFGADNQYALLRVCNQVLVEIAQEPWAGDTTLACVMDQAATRFIRSHGNVPKSWLKVRSDLRDGKANTSPDKLDD